MKDRKWSLRVRVTPLAERKLERMEQVFDRRRTLKIGIRATKGATFPTEPDHQFQQISGGERRAARRVEVSAIGTEEQLSGHDKSATNIDLPHPNSLPSGWSLCGGRASVPARGTAGTEGRPTKVMHDVEVGDRRQLYEAIRRALCAQAHGKYFAIGHKRFVIKNLQRRAVAGIFFTRRRPGGAHRPPKD